MPTLRRIGLGAAIVVLLGVAAGAWYLYGPVPVPEGYHFPRHSLWGGGPLALYEGMLVETDGCVRSDDGSTVVWPPGYRLDIEDGEPVVRGGGRTVRMGESVRMVGGWYERGPLPEVMSSATGAGCPAPYFLTTGWAD